MGNLKFGTNEPLALYMGASESTKAYYGTTEVYSGGGTDYSKEYLTFEIISGNSIEWIPYFTDQEIYYSINDGEWTTDGPGASSSLSVEPGDIIRFKGNNDAYAQTNVKSGHFASTETYFNVEGNILSMIYGDGFTGQTEFPQSVVSGYQFAAIFKETGVLSAENLILPQDVRANCYVLMFKGCTSLTAAPELPATTLVTNCYQNMFDGCSSLTIAPELPATTLATGCYRSMFSGCTSLTAASELPATSLAKECYYGMFNGCASLTAAPELPATTLVISCFQNMFKGCTSLTAAPELPATSLADKCYQGMFSGCTSLSYIKCLSGGANTTRTQNWVSNVPSSGTFVKSANASWSTGVSGIPSGWTVIET